MRGLFVTATDTGVGKTEVACALLADARARGLDVGAMKPAQSGHAPGEPSDAERLRAAAGDGDPPSSSVPTRSPRRSRRRWRRGWRARTVSLERDPRRGARARGAPRRAARRGRGRALVPLTDARDLRRPRGRARAAGAGGGAGRPRHREPHRADRGGAPVARPRRAGVGARTGRARGTMRPCRYNAAEIARLTGARVLATLPFERDIAARERRIAERCCARKSSSRPLVPENGSIARSILEIAGVHERRRSQPSAPRPAAPSTASSTRAGLGFFVKPRPRRAAPHLDSRRIAWVVEAGPAPGRAATTAIPTRSPAPAASSAASSSAASPSACCRPGCSVRSGHFRSAGHQR